MKNILTAMNLRNFSVSPWRIGFRKQLGLTISLVFLVLLFILLVATAYFLPRYAGIDAANKELIKALLLIVVILIYKQFS
jgi:hypothetical protein